MDETRAKPKGSGMDLDGPTMPSPMFFLVDYPIIPPHVGPNAGSYYIMVLILNIVFFGVYTGSAFLLLELVVQTKRMIIKKTMRKYQET